MNFQPGNEMAEKQQSGSDGRESDEEQAGVSEALVDALVKKLEAGVAEKLQKKFSVKETPLGEQ